jgi:hypothetical protein
MVRYVRNAGSTHVAHQHTLSLMNPELSGRPRVRTGRVDGRGYGYRIASASAAGSKSARGSHTVRYIAAICVTLLVAGVGFVILGLLGDERGWWSDRPFLTNLLTAIAGACFGIPLAIAVLQSLSRLQGHLYERRKNFEKIASLGANLLGRVEVLRNWWPLGRHHVQDHDD